MSSFLSEGEGYAPASGQITGILSEMKETMGKDLGDLTAKEETTKKSFEELGPPIVPIGPPPKRQRRHGDVAHASSSTATSSTKATAVKTPVLGKPMPPAMIAAMAAAAAAAAAPPRPLGPTKPPQVPPPAHLLKPKPELPPPPPPPKRLGDLTAKEEAAKKSFEELVAAKNKELQANSEAIEAQTAGHGDGADRRRAEVHVSDAAQQEKCSKNQALWGAFMTLLTSTIWFSFREAGNAPRESKTPDSMCLDDKSTTESAAALVWFLAVCTAALCRTGPWRWTRHALCPVSAVSRSTLGGAIAAAMAYDCLVKSAATAHLGRALRHGGHWRRWTRHMGLGRRRHVGFSCWAPCFGFASQMRQVILPTRNGRWFYHPYAASDIANQKRQVTLPTRSGKEHCQPEATVPSWTRGVTSASASAISAIRPLSTFPSRSRHIYAPASNFSSVVADEQITPAARTRVSAAHVGPSRA